MNFFKKKKCWNLHEYNFTIIFGVTFINQNIYYIILLKNKLSKFEY